MNHLSELVEALRGLPDDRAAWRDRAGDVLGRVRFESDELEKYLHFRSDAYARNLIVRTDLFELLALCWEPGQITPIHDHAGSDGWLLGMMGRLEEVRYRFLSAPAESARIERAGTAGVMPGQFTYINDDIGWHTVANPARRRGVSLHLYCAPIDACKVFDPITRAVRTRRLTYHSVDGVIRGAQPVPPAGLST